MPQKLSLTNPIVPPPGVNQTSYVIRKFSFENMPWATLSVTVDSDTGVRVTKTYSDEAGGGVAAAFILLLNTANMASNSLTKRVLERLVSDGVLPPGTVTGSP